MSGLVKVGGAWKDVAGMSVKVDGAWKTVDKGYTNIAGTWKEFYAPVAGAFDLLETVVLTSAASSVTFTNLATYGAEYKHLQIRYTARSTRAAGATPLYMHVNGITAAGYTYHRLYGNGSSVNSDAVAGATNGDVALIAAANSTANSFGVGVIDLLNPFDGNKNPVARNLFGVTGDNYTGIYSWMYPSATAVSSIRLWDYYGSFVIGTRFSIYGIR